MHSQRKALLSFITIFLSLFLQSPCQAVLSPSSAPFLDLPAIPPLVQQLCAKTAASEPFCIKTLTSDKRSWQAKTFVDLTKIFLPLGADYAQHTQTYIDVLAKNMNGMTLEAQMALRNCSDRYRTIFEDFKGAISDVEHGDYDTANNDISLAFFNNGLCVRALSNAKVNLQGLSNAIDVTRNYIYVSGTFIDSLIRTYFMNYVF
ncbi:hypothetical protein M5689_024074 [Euphorbia peplus]|nr:hypothetical protein M5689_024074 [Euphorbia peplus]